MKKYAIIAAVVAALAGISLLNDRTKNASVIQNTAGRVTNSIKGVDISPSQAIWHEYCQKNKC